MAIMPVINLHNCIIKESGIYAAVMPNDSLNDVIHRGSQAWLKMKLKFLLCNVAAR